MDAEHNNKFPHFMCVGWYRKKPNKKKTLFLCRNFIDSLMHQCNKVSKLAVIIEDMIVGCVRCARATIDFRQLMNVCKCILASPTTRGALKENGYSFFHAMILHTHTHTFCALKSFYVWSYFVVEILKVRTKFVNVCSKRTSAKTATKFLFETYFWLAILDHSDACDF